MSLASKVIVKVNQFSQETSQTEAEDWLKRKTPPSKPLWVRAKEIAVKERGLAANIKASDKKKKRNARGSLSQSWWSALELEKRKAVSPIVSTMAPDNVVSTANRFFQKGHKASEKIKLDLVEGIYREMHFERKDVSSLSGSDPDPFGLLHGPSGTSGTFFDDLTNPDPILDVYGLHDQNTIMSVTPCRAISLLQSLPTDKDSVHMEKAGEANTEVKIEKPMHSLIKKEIEIDQKEPRDPMDSRRSVQEGGGVGRMMARTSFGRVMGAFKSPPEPEGGDKEFGGTVGQLLETWVWLSTSKQNEHVGGPVNMDSIVLTEYLEKKYLTPTLPRTRIIDASYREQCIQMVERCAEIIRMAQTVVEDEDAKDYFLELLLRKSDKWAGFPEPPVEVSLPAAQGAQVATSVPQTDSLVGKDSLCGSALISWQSALDALQRVCEDPTSHLARQEAREMLESVVKAADSEESHTLVAQDRLRLRVRYEVAVMDFEEVMAGNRESGGLTEELLELLEVLSDPLKDPYDGTRRPHPSPSPWFAPDHSYDPLAEVDEIRCMLAQLALHPMTADLSLAQHHYREIGKSRFYPSSRMLLASDWPAPDQSMAWIRDEKEDMMAKKDRPRT